MSYHSKREKKDDNDIIARNKEDEDDGEVTFDQTPVRVVCPHCGLNVITFIEHESSWVTYVVSIVLLLVLNWAALCVVPVVFPLFKDVVHHCPRCLSVLATRSRVAVTSFREEVMSFRFGSCVIVLARKYVLLLLGFSVLIGGIHYLRSGTSAPSGLDAVVRSELQSLGWEDFLKDCGFKSYLGNPIHVTMAFNQRYRNKTFSWQGSVHHVEEGLNFLWWNQKGALYVRMQPPQFPQKKEMADLVLLYNDYDKEIGGQVAKLKRGAPFSFEATMVEVGRRGSPHLMLMWELHPLDAALASSQGTGKSILTGKEANTSSPATSAGVHKELGLAAISSGSLNRTAGDAGATEP